jgi:hypothetical protein
VRVWYVTPAVHPSAVPWAFLAASWIALGCGAGRQDTGPAEVLHAYAQALQEGRLRDAYDLLSDEAKKGMPFEAFQTMAQENREEVQELSAALRRPMSPPRVTAVIGTPDGEELLLVYEAGAWRVDGSAIDLYDQTSPRASVVSFIRAVENRRYDILMRFVPDDKREGLDPEKLRAAFEGEQQEEVQRLSEALRAALPTAELERVGDRATLGYGAGGTVQLVREHGVWKIEEF